MSEQSAVCKRCGIGFLITPYSLGQLRRWGTRVSVPQLCTRCFRRKGPLPKRRGTVQWFDRRKHYGFIVGGQGDRIFVHRNAFYEPHRSRPYEGQAAVFHVHYADKGPKALNVELMETVKPCSQESRER